MNKICKKCLIEQDINNFYAAKQGKLGRASRCKSCLKEEASRPERIEMARKSRDRYYSKNKEKQSESSKEKYRQNPEFYIKKAKLWKENNKERSDEWKKKYLSNNKDKINKYFRDYMKELRATSPHYRIKMNMSYAIWRGLRKNKFGHSWQDLIPYTPKELMDHLESKFTDGMSWQNYGKGGWHIDHVIPQSYFKFDSYDHPAFIACWSLSNLQPMWSNQNLSKGNRIELTPDIQAFLDSVNQPL
jgi:hypothetical protein